MELQPGEQWFNDCYYIFIQFKHDYCDCELCQWTRPTFSLLTQRPQ